ncbi:hypothetical protein ACFXJ8_43350 [Nonomuraea sp. NPDC059194]
MLGAGAFYLAAILTAVLLLRPRPASHGTESTHSAALDEVRSTHL